MKNFNILKAGVLFIGVIGLLTSCDNFLDIKPVGKVIPTTQKDFRALITDSYSKMPAARSLSTVRGDEVTLSASASGAGRLRDIFTWNDITPDPTTHPFPWQAFYKVIFNTNHLITNAPEAINAKKEELDQLVGEAHILRAYMYFYLVNTYANPYDKERANSEKAVPIVPEEVDLERVYHPSTTQEVYDHIIKDINEGIRLMNIDIQPAGLNYRFSKVSAYGFAARVYQFMNDWKNAIEYSDKAMKIRSTLVDFKAVDAEKRFVYKYNSEENILALEQTFANRIKLDVKASDKIKNAYDADGDLRKGSFFKGSNILLGGRDNANKVSMRTAELYLIKAEALAHNTVTIDQAKAVLKQLLEKRLTVKYYKTRAAEIDALSNDKILPVIYEERFRELAFQGYRWFDLRRTTRPELVHVYDGKTYKLAKNDPRYTLRFPQEAIDNNPNLK